MVETVTTAKRPLDGVRVIDLADERGELCGRLLADLGADVLRVEPPGGARSRSLPPFAPDGTSLYFAYRNTNKRGTVLDLDEAGDRERLRALVASAEVFVESHAPGHLDSLGLGHEALLDLNPGLIVASLTDFGQDGPDSGLVATDDVIVARSGWLSLSGIPEKPPLLVPGAVAHDSLGVLGAYAVVLALLHKDRGAGGQHLDVSALEVLAQMNTWAIPNADYSQRHGGTPQIVRSGDSPMYPNIPCADGMVRQVVLAPRQWRALWEWMGSPEAFADEYWESTFSRLMNMDVLNPLFWEHWADRPKVEGSVEAQRRGIVALPMLTPAEILGSEHFAARDSFLDVEVAVGVVGPVMAGFGEIDGERSGYAFRSPATGEHEADFAGSGPPDPVEVAEPAPLPLAGLRVVDFGHGGVGVECGRMLAEYGADVVKVESRTYPDFIRLVLGSEMTPAFASSSRSKRGFGADLKHPDGIAVVRELVKRADVVIENNSTGTMADLGLAYDDLQALNPGLVMVSSQLMGSRGPFADWSGYGPTIQSVGGLSWLWKFDDGDPPPGSPAIHPDHLAGRVCALFAAAALFARNRSRGGAHVEIAQVEALMATLGDLFLAEGLEPGSVRPMGNDSLRGAPWGVFPCVGDERWCVVCVRDDSDWASLRDAMGDPAWADDDRFASTDGRLAHRREVNDGVAAWTIGRSQEDVVAACRLHGVPAAPVASTVDQLKDPHLLGRGFFPEVDQPPLGPLTLDGPCFRGTVMRTPFLGPAPGLGEHTRSICIEELGMDPDEVEQLIESGALEVDTSAVGGEPDSDG